MSIRVQAQLVKTEQKHPMLISHKYKFIFIKNHKTASTSTQLELARFMTKGDTFAPKALKYPKRSGLFASAHRSYMIRLERWLRLDERWHGHMPARDVKKHIGAEVFDSYFKFCVEREPVDKCISKYWFLKGHPNSNVRKRWVNKSWEQFFDDIEPWPIDTHLWTDKAGHLMMNRILRYENLNEEIRQVGRELGFHIEGINSYRGKRTRRPGIKITEEQREMIYQAFAESNRHTGYKIEDCKFTL
ncbi:MAG: hypothetical protein GDA40_06090 [Rhodobacteraceae bacterium]|nr:hypothetical protein [Paracoccaceae bacterium]